MPQDVPGAVSPLAPFEGSYTTDNLHLTVRWFDGSDFTPEIRDEVLNVIRVAFNGHPSWFSLGVPPQDHLDWKFRDRPTGTGPVVTLDPEGRVIGFTGGVRRIWHLKGRPYVARAGYDFCRLPEWQGRGVGRELQPFRGRGWHPSEDFGFGYVTHPADRHYSIQRGNKAPANETHDYVLLLHPVRRLRGLLRRAPSGVQDAEGALSSTAPVIRAREGSRAQRLRRITHRATAFAASLLARRPAPKPGLTISTITSFQDRHAPFIARALQEFDFVADRSIDYLNWRYCDPRGGPFTVRLAERDGQPVGYAVTRVLHGGAYLGDILVLPNHPEAVEALVRDAIGLAKHAGADSVLTRLPKHHPYRRALSRSGFFDLGHVAGELVDPRGLPASELALLDDEHARIHHVLADSDYL